MTIATTKQITTNNCRDNWINYIDSTGTFKHFLTVTFDYGTNKTTCYQSMNSLLHRMNQHIFGRRYKHKQFITGFSFTELQKNNQTHFHILIHNNSQFTVPNKPSFDLHLTRRLYEFGYNYFLFKVKRSNSLHINNVVLKPIYSQKRLISYCTKNMHGNNNSNFISLLGPNGLIYI